MSRSSDLILVFLLSLLSHAWRMSTVSGFVFLRLPSKFPSRASDPEWPREEALISLHTCADRHKSLTRSRGSIWILIYVDVQRRRPLVLTSYGFPSVFLLVCRKNKLSFISDFSSFSFQLTNQNYKKIHLMETRQLTFSDKKILCFFYLQNCNRNTFMALSHMVMLLLEETRKTDFLDFQNTDFIFLENFEI